MRSFARRASGRRLASLPLSLTLVAFAAVALAASAPEAEAHAYLRASTPAAGSTLGSAPSAITLTFSEAAELRLALIKVVDSTGTDHVTGPVVAAASPPATISAPLGALADGVYKVSWRAVSAVDGHISAGTFAFGVGTPAPTTGPAAGPIAEGSDNGTLPSAVARWLLYLGIVALFGTASVALAVVRTPAPDLLLVAAGGWTLTFVGTVAVVGVQWIETGAPLETLIGTEIGLAMLARVVSVVLVGASLIALAAVPAFAATRGWAAVSLSAAAVLFVDVLSGHAAAGPSWLLQVIAQVTHGLAAAALVGGLLGLLLSIRSVPNGERLAAARRYSGWAGVAIALVAVTGAARAYAEIGSVDALVGTDFGKVVIAKSVLLVALGGLGAFNRFVTLSDAVKLVGRVRRVGGAEVVIAVAIVGLSGLLVNLSPPALAASPAAAAAQPVITSGVDAGGGLHARLLVTPGRAGDDAFDLALADGITGAVVDAHAVDLRFEVASAPGVASTVLALARGTAGNYAASGTNLSIDGIWRITAIATLAARTIEIPLVLATRVADQAVQRVVSAGAPTIFRVSLGAIGSAEVYLDPGGASPREIHVTFFDNAGNEQPIDAATVALTTPDGAGEVVAARMLRAGSFVASVDAGTGSLTVDVVTPLPAARGSGHIHLHVTIEVTP